MNTIRPILPVMILAAGFGKRLQPLTNHTPKALVELGGKPLLETTITKLKAIGFNNIIINTHYLADKIHDFLNSKFPNQIQISHEPQILETGGGILQAFKLFKYSPIMVINCDTFFPNLTNVVAELLNHWQPDKMDILAVLKCSNNKGDFNIDSHNKLLLDDIAPYIYTGLYIIKPEIISKVGRKNFSITKDFIMPELHNPNHKLYGYITKELWFDIGTLSSLNEANKILQKEDNL